MLDYMFAKRQIYYKTNKKSRYMPNEYGNVAMKPFNLKVFQFLTKPDLSKRSIMRDCAEYGAQLKMVTRKLNQTGYIQHHCGLVNTEA
jgi:hypothetical protein